MNLEILELLTTTRIQFFQLIKKRKEEMEAEFAQGNFDLSWFKLHL